jgi:hypothetical protein
MLLFVYCNSPKQPHAAYVPISQLEPSYGQLITVSNAPTQDQHGTGDRLGLFRDSGGTVGEYRLRLLTMATCLDVRPRYSESSR